MICKWGCDARAESLWSVFDLQKASEKKKLSLELKRIDYIKMKCYTIISIVQCSTKRMCFMVIGSI